MLAQPRPARDREDRLEVEGVRAAELLLVVVAREEEAQERAAQGLGAELVHGFRPFCALLLALCAPNLGRFAPRLLVWRKNAGVGRPGPGVRQQCGRAVDAWGSLWPIALQKNGV